MAAPFDSDDLMKRSLFGAIFGFKKNNSSNNTSRSRASSVDQPDQPGPSWASAPQSHHVVVPAAQPAAVPAATVPAASVSHGQPPAENGFFPPYPSHGHPSFSSSHPPPLPVLTTQCPFSRQSSSLAYSYSSLAHQTHPPGSFPPHASAAAPYASYAGAYAAPPPPYSPYAPPPPPHASDADYHRTKADIYREIVHECEEFERSSTTTPLVESSPATPTVHSPLGSQWSAQMPQQQPIHEITANFSMMDLPPATFHSLDQQRVANIVQQQIDVKPILGDKEAMEALVRLVVQAVKDTGAVSSPSNTQSPEEILKRKRQMNNEAAARYRKRQREEKEKQHVELDSLEQRNLDLKRTVDDMEREIAVLKKYVLEQSRQTTLPKVEEEPA